MYGICQEFTAERHSIPDPRDRTVDISITIRGHVSAVHVSYTLYGLITVTVPFFRLRMHRTGGTQLQAEH